VGSNPTTPTILPGLESSSFTDLRAFEPRFALSPVWRPRSSWSSASSAR